MPSAANVAVSRVMVGPWYPATWCRIIWIFTRIGTVRHMADSETTATCETHGHQWGVNGKCIRCGEPMPARPWEPWPIDPARLSSNSPYHETVSF
jgi:hypothetical protein